MRSGASDLDVRSGRIEGPVVIVMMIVLRPAAASARTFHVFPRMCWCETTLRPAEQARPTNAAFRSMRLGNVTYKYISLGSQPRALPLTRHAARCLELSLMKSGA